MVISLASRVDVVVVAVFYDRQSCRLAAVAHACAWAVSNNDLSVTEMYAVFRLVRNGHDCRQPMLGWIPRDGLNEFKNSSRVRRNGTYFSD